MSNVPTLLTEDSDEFKVSGFPIVYRVYQVVFPAVEGYAGEWKWSILINYSHKMHCFQDIKYE